jgi:hypothetical protein
MGIDAATVEWLKEGVLFEASTDAGVAAAWGDLAVESKIVSPLALAAAAATEAARQQTFLEGPLAVEVHDVAGLRTDLFCRPVTITSDRLGYEAGLDVFVIGVEESVQVARTQLTVLRRLT